LEDDDVLPKARPYTGNRLKMNGYYYQKAYNSFLRYKIMYINGILIDTGGIDYTIEEMDDYIRKNYIQSNGYKRSKYDWGVFFIDENNISIHQLVRDYPHREKVFEGVILNDTTFLLTKYSSENYESEEEYIYHFREFYPKPDSTNSYIK
jgi:hypothetical protein